MHYVKTADIVYTALQKKQQTPHNRGIFIRVIELGLPVTVVISLPGHLNLHVLCDLYTFNSFDLTRLKNKFPRKHDKRPGTVHIHTYTYYTHLYIMHIICIYVLSVIYQHQLYLYIRTVCIVGYFEQPTVLT